MLVSAMVLSGCDWIMYRSNAALTGESVGETVIGVGNVETLSEAWTTRPSDYVISRDPVVVGGRVYMQTADRSGGESTTFPSR